MKDLATARVLFYVMGGSFAFSAALLGAFRLAGRTVPTFVLVGWAALGAAAIGLTPLLTADRRWVALLLAAVLGPWMAWSLANDVRAKLYPIAATDVAGLIAIGFGVWLSYRP